MTIYACDACGKVFNRKEHLTKHLSRKTPCKSDDDKKHTCDRCGKHFSFDSNLSRHRRTCKVPNEHLADLLAQANAKIDTLERKIEASTSSVTNIDNSVNNVTNNTNIDNSINITLNNYGSESQDHLEALSFADLKKTLKLTPDHESLIRMIAFIYLNEAVPQNRTIRLDDKDSSTINVFKRGRWREQDANTVLYDLICRNRLRFVDLEEILTKNMSKGKFEELSHYLCKAEDMANSENADIHVEYAFRDLMSMIREKVAV